MKDLRSSGENENYNMKDYWSKRARFGLNMYEKICAYGVPSQFNEIMDRTQKDCLNSLLTKIPSIHGKKVLEIGCGIGRWGVL